MASQQKMRKPDDLAFPYLTLDDLCFVHDEGVYGEVRDAATCTRGQAIAYYASETTGDFTDVRCVVRYVLLHTRQDIWDGPGREQWADDHIADHLAATGVRLSLVEAWKQSPDVPPSSWTPEEYSPCWSVCSKNHPRARKAWMCEIKGDDRIPDAPALASEPTRDEERAG
jgi:hypothetical protein